MKKLFSVLFSRWLMSLLGLLALAVVIWVLGPRLEINDKHVLASETVRMILIGGLFVLWCFKMLGSRWRHLSANAALLEGMVRSRKEDKPANPAQGQIDTLSERFTDAVGKLKKARLGPGSGKQFLYQLPWYMFIGPPGCGKSTALLNSGLNFPLANEMGSDDVRGVGGTRNCDWFFTDEAVLLDTAGRYATQDSDKSVDSAEWTAFLTLLKKHRRRRPINGVMVTLSAQELLEQSPDARRRQASEIRKRVLELYDELNMRVPIYVVVTKCDLLAGFIEYFARLRTEERSQVWGFTFPEATIDNDEDAIGRFTAEFEQLEQRLQAQLLDRVQAESSEYRRALIFSFPEQFAALKPVLDPMLADIFRQDRYTTKPLVRGVYFVSGTQSGLPMDRLLGELSANLGIARSGASQAADTGQSFFLGRLLHDVVFKEADLAGTNLRFERYRSAAQYGTYAAVTALILAGALAWYTSYQRNSELVAQIDERAASTQAMASAINNQQTAPADLVPLLDTARGLVTEAPRNEPGNLLLARTGLYQAPKLAAEANETYESLLVDQFLPRVVLALEQVLSRPQLPFEARYELLKVYLMLDDPERYEREDVENLLGPLITAGTGEQLTDALRASLTTHVSSLLTTMESRGIGGLNLNEPLVASVRGALTEQSKPARAYALIKQSSNVRALPSPSLLSRTGLEAPLVLQRVGGDRMQSSVPGLFTPAGYKAYEGARALASTQLAREDWVLGSAATTLDGLDVKRLVSDIDSLYGDEYIKVWSELLRDFRTISFNNPREAEEALRIISDPERSPLFELFDSVRANTDLLGSASLLGKRGESIKSAVKGGSSAVQDLINRLSNDGDGSRTARPVTATPRERISARFAELNAMTEELDGSVPFVADILAPLAELWRRMSKVVQTPDDELGKRAKEHIQGLSEALRERAGHSPEPLNDMLDRLANDSAQVVLKRVSGAFNQEWADIYRFCVDGIKDRYPLDRGATKAVTMADFGQFFGPQGMMASFFDKNLRSLVNTSKNRWELNEVGRQGSTLSSAALRQFQHADTVRKVFFSGGGSKPSFEFQLTPRSMDAGVINVVLNLEGQRLSFVESRSTPMNFTWPGPEPNQASIQRLPPEAGGAVTQIPKRGDWAGFQLLGEATITESAQKELFSAEFNIGGRTVNYELKAGSVRNPFGLLELDAFRCVSRL